MNCNKIGLVSCKIILLVIILYLILCLSGNYFYRYKIIAETDNIQTANNLQEFILDAMTPVIIRQDGVKYQILVNSSDKKIDKLLLQIADSSFFNSSISLKESETNKKAFLNDLNDLCYVYSKKVNQIGGVQSNTISISIKDFNDTKRIIALVNVIIESPVNTETVSRVIRNLLCGSILGLLPENIEINFNKEQTGEFYSKDVVGNSLRYYNIAEKYYKIQDYQMSEKYLREAVKRNTAYNTSLNALKEIIQINLQIAKNPKDYKLYLKRGDLENHDTYSIFINDTYITANCYAAEKDYKMALKLNSKAYEIYERLGDTYVNRFENKNKDYKKAIFYYEKALKYLGGSDRLYTKLGQAYSFIDAQKAIEYYNKIENINLPKRLNSCIPYADGDYDYIPLKIAHLYAKKKDYNEALKYVDRTITNCSDKNIVQYAYNNKFLYNWKAGHYNLALKSAKDCNTFVCRFLALK